MWLSKLWAYAHNFDNHINTFLVHSSNRMNTMTGSDYQPIYEFTRGSTVESIHYGAIAVVDVTGKMIASFGDPGAVTYLRSSAKPFQALPFIEHGGQAIFNLTPREIALMCASHSGTDEHVAVAQAMQVKTGVAEADLLCGVHYPIDDSTAQIMKEQQQKPTPNRHNCSGKHTGMLAFLHLKELSGHPVDEGLAYIDFDNPIQREIMQTFASLCGLSENDVKVGVDGCSAPNFAVPLQNAALGFARLCDPDQGNVRPVERAAACRTITSAMIFNPDMVGGPGRFDTRLMETVHGRLVAKGGAEGYQGIGLLPGALGEDSPALGIALKISDGDVKSRAVQAVALEVLRQLGALSEAELGILSEFGPKQPVLNWRKLVVGEGRPCFQLKFDRS
jgi:L-asparaginase II